MANKNSSINLVDLDQQALLNDFRNYLRSQDQFKDYDFKGSGMNVLLDLLAYNTYKNAFYFNMAFSERWLDSAQLRSSIFSHAKELNYLPRSIRSAKAKVRVNFEASGESQPYVLQKGSQFSTIVKSKSLTFTLPETLILTSADTNFEFTTDIYEGIYVKDSYVMTEENQKFKITNKNVDTRSISVTVFEDNQELGFTYKQTSSLLDLDNNSQAYFIQTSETGNYELIFGDNVVGRMPKMGAIIVIDYRVSIGVEGNGAKSFSVDFDPTSSSELLSSPELEVIEASANGDAAESNESIKYYAPRHYQVQERTVTNDDYEVTLKQAFPEINAVSVFGGEELSPPKFGKVFIAIDIKNIDGLPDSKIEEYSNYINRRSPFSVMPVFIEPEFLYLAVSSNVRYNINVTTNSINRIKALVTDAINTYNFAQLNDFNVIFRNSLFSNIIDEADSSIISNISNVVVYKKINPVLNKSGNFVLDFGIALQNNIPLQQSIYPIDDIRTVYSSTFTYQGEICSIEDNGDGVLRIVKTQEKNKISITNIGTVDYTTGLIKIVDFRVSAYEGSAIKIFTTPSDKDIKATKNNIMLIEPADVSVTVESLRE